MASKAIQDLSSRLAGAGFSQIEMGKDGLPRDMHPVVRDSLLNHIKPSPQRKQTGALVYLRKTDEVDKRENWQYVFVIPIDKVENTGRKPEVIQTPGGFMVRSYCLKIDALDFRLEKPSGDATLVSGGFYADGTPVDEFYAKKVLEQLFG